MSEYKTLDFESLELPSSPNYFIAYPEQKYNRQVISPVFDCSAESLSGKWSELVLQMARTKTLVEDVNRRQFIYIQRSRVLRFPDIIYLQFIPIDETHCTVAIYSHSVYGYSDFGVNKKRVENWLKLLGCHSLI